MRLGFNSRKRRLVLDLMARKRSRFARAIVGVTSLAILLGPLHLAAFAAEPSVTKGGSLPDDSARRTSERLRPVAVEDLSGKMPVDALWRLFDGDATSGLEVWAATRIRLTFAEPIAVDAVGAYGPAGGALSLLDAGGKATAEASADLSKGDPRWIRLLNKNAVAARTFELQWTPTQPGAVLPELEVWGRGTGAAKTSSASRDVLPDALYDGLPRGTAAFSAKDGERAIAASTPQADRTFSIALPDDPRSIERAFLVYELSALPHFTAAKRAINGGPAVGGFGVSRGAKGGLQVEEIAPAALRKGGNTIRFDPAHDTDPVGYRVAQVRIVTAHASPARALADDASFGDGLESTGWGSGKEALHRWRWDSLTQPRELELRLARGEQGTLVIAGGTGLRRQRVTVDLSALKPGWHKVALDALPPVESLTAVLEGKHEGSVFLSEMSITGSPLPDGKPALRVTYPLHGECVNHNVHVRGLATPVPTTVRANGKPMRDVVFDRGAFSFTASEKDLGGGNGKPFSFVVEAQVAKGAAAQTEVSVQGCVDRPPVVAGADGARRQPVVDVGAPYGAVVTRDKDAVLSFAGAELNVPAGAVEADVRLTVRPLNPAEVPPMDAGMTNVTKGGRAFRLGPHGMQFKKAVALSLPVDPSRVEPSEVARTYYYDETARKWQEVASLGETRTQVTAQTTHFTDFITATMVMPEHPGVNSMNPTSLKDIKIADPGAGVAQIAPPEPNSEGTANLSYPIEVPPGRNGLQPQLALTYDSAAENGWMGMGWNVGISQVEIDTRFGVPKYDGTERYRLDGEELVPGATPPGAPAGNYYFRRNEGKFDWIVRVTQNNAYHWIVTDKSGTKYTYGLGNGTRLMSGTNTAKTFRWCLEKVEDIWGNQLLYTYTTISGDLGSTSVKDHYQQIYPNDIKYTGGTYSVVFKLKTTPRADAFSTARPGFLVLTNQLLDSIEVRNGTNIIRKYVLAYTTGDFGKNLLSTISLFGKGGGGNALAKHGLTYHSTPKGSDNNPKYFGPPVNWAQMLKGDYSPATDVALSNSASNETNWGVSVGVPSLNAGASSIDVDTNLDRALEDVNGDGLPDLLPSNRTDGNAHSLTDSGAGLMSVATFQDWAGPYGVDTNSHITSSYNIGFVSGSEDYGNISEAGQFIADINGDGLPDRVARGGSTPDAVVVRLNAGNFEGFLPPREFPGYSGTGLKFSCGQIFTSSQAQLAAAAAGPTFPSVDIVTKWEAPFTGSIRISGILGRVSTDPTGGDGMIASLFYGNTLLWQRDFSGTDRTQCTPNGLGSSCGPPTGGIQMYIQKGERLYTRINAKSNTDADVIKWDTTVEYIDTPLGEKNSRESWGAYRYKFSEELDQRAMGEHYTPWTAVATGAVNVVLDIEKDWTADNVTLMIGLHSPTRGDYILEQLFYAGNDRFGSRQIDLGNHDVQTGDQVHVWAKSDLAPIDPETFRVLASITYKNFCRTDPVSGSEYCGEPHCMPLKPEEGEIAGSACTIEPIPWTGVTLDPLARHPVAGSTISQIIPIYHPIENWARRPSQPSNPSPGTVDGRMFAPTPRTTPSTARLCFTNFDYGLIGRPFTYVIQGVNRLIAKQAGSVPAPDNEFPPCLDVNLAGFGLTSNDQLFFSIYSEAPIVGSYQLRAYVNNVLQPLSVVENFYRDTTQFTISQFPYVGASAAMSGGFHSFWLGTWNGNRPFDESMITEDPFNDSFLPLQAGPIPSPDPPTGASLTAASGSVQLSFSIGGLFKKIGGYIAGGARYIWNKATSLVKIVGTTCIKAVRALGSLAGKIMAWALCELSDSSYTVTGMRYSETHSKTEGMGFDAGLSISIATSSGKTLGGMDMMDMNGDRYADQVSTAGIRYLNYEPSSMTGFFAPAVPLVKLPGSALRIGSNRMYTIQVGTSGGASFKGDSQSSDSGGKSSGVQVGGGLATRVSQGYARLSRDLRDINGDGLPDLIEVIPSAGNPHPDAALYRIQVQLNYGSVVGFGAPIIWSSAMWSNTAPNPPNLFAASAGGPTQFLDALRNQVTSNEVDTSGTIRLEETGHKGGSVGLNVSNGVIGGGVGFQMDKTYVRTIVDLVDVNGDGLPDQVMKVPGAGQPFRVKLNTGTAFGPETTSQADAWPNLNGMLHTNGAPVTAALVDTLGFTRSESWDVNGNGQYLVFGANGGYGEGHQASIVALMDINGDGRLDHVIKNADIDGFMSTNDRVWARLNQVGKSNLLAKVTQPLGGSVSLDYARTGNLVSSFWTPMGFMKTDSPDSRLVLSQVTVEDGRGGSQVDTIDYRMSVFGQSNLVASGFYDRNEREFLGFGRVTITHGTTATNGDGSKKRLYFMNQDYHHRGRLQAEYDIGGDGLVLRGSYKNFYFDSTPGVTLRSSQYVSFVESFDITHNGRVTAAALDTTDLRMFGLWPVAPNGSIVHYSYRSFDNDGNMSNFVDYGDSAIDSDGAVFTLQPITFPGKRFTAVQSITASSMTTGALFQRRTATYTLQSDRPVLTQMSDLIYGGNIPGTTTPYDGQATTHTFTYDPADMGGIKTYTDPTGYKLTYTYDSTRTYVTNVTDSFGYASSSTPNLDFGKPATTTDQNGKVVTYNYDLFGRLDKVWGPTDPTTGTATIQMSYSQGATATPAFPAWAMTKHKDGTSTATIDTVTFADGMGRIIQTKKEAEILVSGVKQTGFSVSGQMLFDGRGRVMSQSQPFFSTAANTTFVVPSALNATVFSYDGVGRTTVVTIPDPHPAQGFVTTSTRFATIMPGTSGDDGMPGAISTLELIAETDAHGVVRRTYKDGAGHVVAVKEFNTIRNARTALITRYEYDGLDNVIGVVDALNNRTSAVYDSLGRIVSLTSPDAGRTEHRYNVNGLLAEKQTSNLRSVNQLIRYGYDVNRLKTITYPSSGVVTYTYGLPTEKGDAAGNVAGRIKSVAMEGGTETRTYDAFGNVNKTVTTLKHINNTTLASPVATMKFSYDWLGRMRTMTFPNIVDNNWNIPPGDGEVVTYNYDNGGLLRQITSVSGTSTETYVADIGYDVFGQRTLLKSGNNISNNYTYEPKRRFLKTITATAAPTSGSVQFHALTYDFDLVGNIKTLTNTPPQSAIRSDGTAVGVGPLSVTYGYDEQNQLVSSTARYRGHSTRGYRYATTFEYDEIGNLIKKAQTDVRLVFRASDTSLTQGTDGPTIPGTTYTLVPSYPAGRAHQATSVAETPASGSVQTRTVQFDSNGNKAGDAIGTSTQAFSWDEENRLKTAQKVVSGVTTTSRFLYNPDGDRTQRQDPGGTTTFYVNQFLVMHGDKNVTKHIYAGETRVVSKMRSAQNTTPLRQFYHPDHLGSSSYFTDGSQNLIGHERYFPFGETWVEPGLTERTSANGHREWLFTGKELDAHTGLYYYGARYYDPRSSTWASPDPILARYMRGGPNDGVFSPKNLALYSYGWNNPVILRDPNGLEVQPIFVPENFVGPLLPFQRRSNASTHKLPNNIVGTTSDGVAHVGVTREVFEQREMEVQRLQTLEDLSGAHSTAVLGGGLLPDAVVLRDPQTIRFSQDSIKEGFKNPKYGTFRDLVEGLKSGKVKPTDVEPIRLVERDGNLISIDNRRLEAFKEAGVQVQTRMATGREIAEATRQGKFSAGPTGSPTIRIRPARPMEGSRNPRGK